MLILPTSTCNIHEFMVAAGRLDTDVVIASDLQPVLAPPAGVLELALDEPDRAVAQIAEYSRQWPVSAVIGANDHAALLAAMACEALGIPHNTPDSVRAAGNKLLLRQKLAPSSLPSPGFEVVDLEADVGAVAARAGYPCVLKPVFLTASRGVIRADDARGFAAAFERIRGILTQPGVARRGGEASRSILVEEYVPGIEVALEGLLDAGRLRVLALFDKPDPLEGPYFAETLYVTPSRLDAETQAAIARHVEEAAAVLGLREGPVHAELRLNEQGIFVIELAARAIGGLCSRILEFGAGISLEELILRHALGQPVDALELTGTAGGVMMLPVPARGRLRAVDGTDGARLVPGVEDVVITIPPGQEVQPLPEGDRYLGFIFARGEDPAKVETALRRAYAQMNVVIEADGAGS